MNVEDRLVRVEELVPGRRPALISVSFTGTEAGQDLDRLLATDARGRAVYRLDLLGDMTVLPGSTTLPDLAAAYAQELARLDPRPGALVGHCSAAALTLAIAARMGPRPPRVFLLDPARPTHDSVARTFAELRLGLGRERDGDVDVAEALLRLAAAPADALDWMTAVLAGDAVAFCAEQELDEDAATVTGELIPRYRAWLAFLLAGVGHTTGRAAGTGPVHCLLSRGRDLPAGPADHDRMTVRRLDVAAADLTSTPAVRELLLDHLDQLEEAEDE
ncbi:hypothetical protein [Streptomyces sp. NPDC050704]|uniref:hypothetical protein n=1 Tax=Streptomyces sp. NPDC050704 TaxID=3157219 RepID=UPI00343FAAFB